ncbi:MAG: hypothetical protein ACBZ72_08000 [Candidatus Bathyarchaeia archaeon]|jgi:hypothetical protein
MNEAELTSYRKHLIKSFSCIKGNPTIQRNCSEISILSGTIIDTLKELRDPKNWSLKIDPPWKIPIENDDRYFSQNEAILMLSGILSVENLNFQMYSFVSSIVLKSQKNNDAQITQIPLEDYCEHKHIHKDRLVRRFHFDLAIGENQDNKPVSHFQFGGKEYTNQYPYSLNPKIGIPRIPYPPIDFIILFDMMLRQFKTKIPNSFYDSKDWVSCVKVSEEYRMKAYYEAVVKYFGVKSRKPLSEMLSADTFFL